MCSCEQPRVARLLVQYDGTDFAGWAAQPGRRTVQGSLSQALGTVLRRPAPALTVAGRTDAGVHATAQVVSYAGAPVPVRGLNALLPDDVSVLSCVPASPGFCARHDALSRSYRYRLLTREARSPFEARVSLHWPRSLQVAALRRCAAALVGEHDFTAFTPTETTHVRFRRVIHRAAWVVASPEHLDFVVEADAFMRHMVRVLVGTMLEVGDGRRSTDDFAALLRGAPRPAAGATAPAHGLTLTGVAYPGATVASSAADRGAGA